MYGLALEGPLDSTCVAFWSMILEQDIGIVVMATNLIEKDVSKCAQYFPLNPGKRGRRTFGKKFVITCESIQEHEG